jgi:hypothetical protein
MWQYRLKCEIYVYGRICRGLQKTYRVANSSAGQAPDTPERITGKFNITVSGSPSLTVTKIPASGEVNKGSSLRAGEIVEIVSGVLGAIGATIVRL